VKATGRGSTRPGVSAPLPDGTYTPDSAVTRSSTGGLVVEFDGEDRRHRTFDFGQSPLPGWHQDLAGALARRVGPEGQLRTSSSAIAAWNNLRMFLRYLDELPDRPPVPAALRRQHVETFRAAQVERVGVTYGHRRVDHVWRILRLEPIARHVAADALDAFQIRQPGGPTTSKPGYTDGELHRLLGAARADVARLRDRVRPGADLVHRLRTDPGELTQAQLADATVLAAMIEHGVAAPGRGQRAFVQRQAPAERLFVTRRDVPAMLVLLVAVTARNIETIKELPAEHRVLNGSAVEVRLTKRRRGAGNWSETVTWEIGPPGRELHHPGGLYLMLHALMANSRAAAGDPSSFWAFWRNLRRSPTSTENEHGNPFRAALTAGIDVKGWASEHQLLDDAGESLPVQFHRLRTSVEVRRTRSLGGHLPSAARSNTAAVLFSSYLRDDPTALDWAQEVTTGALQNAERAALDVHRRGVKGAGTVNIISATPAENSAPHRQAGPWSDCRDVSSHPVTARPCRASFLDCFHCGNCMITRDHLPRLLALQTALNDRRQQLPETEWWARYGPAWAAIQHDVLPRFTPAEVERAQQIPHADALLDLVENPWEQT
jgi:hypothetical protein